MHMSDLRLSRRTMIGGAAAAAALLPHGLLARKPITLADVIKRHVRARGGAAALDRVRSCLIELDITEGGSTIHGRYAADFAGLVRIDIYADSKLVYREGVDRQGVWLWPGGSDAPRASEATGAANALLHGAENHLFGLHRFTERGHKLRLMPAETIEGIEHPVIEIVYTTGHTSYFYLDPASWMIVLRRDRRAYHPDVSTAQKRVETRYSDFRTVGGVVAAHRNVDIDLANGAVLSINQVTSRTLNPELPAGAFERSYTPA